MVAYRAYSADPWCDHGHLAEIPAFGEDFESPELGHMESCIFYRTIIFQVYGYLSVTFYPGDWIYLNCFAVLVCHFFLLLVVPHHIRRYLRNPALQYLLEHIKDSVCVWRTTGNINVDFYFIVHRDSFFQKVGNIFPRDNAFRIYCAYSIRIGFPEDIFRFHKVPHAVNTAEYCTVSPSDQDLALFSHLFGDLYFFIIAKCS